MSDDASIKLPKPRIVLITDDDPNVLTFGPTIVTRQLIELLSEDWDVYLVFMSPSHSSGLPAPSAAVWHGHSKFFHQVRNYLRDLLPQLGLIIDVFLYTVLNSERNRILGWIDAQAPTVVLFNNVHTLPLNPGHFAAKHRKLIYLAHDDFQTSFQSIAKASQSLIRRVYYQFFSKIYGKLQRHTARHSTEIWALTEEDRQRFASAAATTKRVLFPYCVNTKKTNAEIKRHAGPIKRILLVGSFHWFPKRKNAIWIVDEVAPLIHRQYPHLVFQIVGRAADLVKRDTQYHHNIEFHNNVPDTVPYYANDCIALVPEHQPSGIKLKAIEAANNYTPLVSTIPGIEGTGLRGEHSCLMAASSTEFVTAVARLVADEDLRTRLSEAAAAEVRSNFNREKSLHILRDCLR